MTQATTELSAAPRKKGLFGRFGAALFGGLDIDTKALSSSDKIAALGALSDAELAAIDLRREDIPRHKR